MVSSSSSPKRVGRFVGRHLVHDIRRHLGLQRFQNAGLHLRIDLGQCLRRHFAVDRADNRLAIAGREFFHNVREIGRMQSLQLVVRNIQPQPPWRIGFDDIAEFPANRLRRDGRCSLRTRAAAPLPERAGG